jgi:hypothetical protein
MGNIVVGSALQHQMVTDNYCMLHAAVPAYCYDDMNSSLEDSFPSFVTPDHDPDSFTRSLGYRGQLKAVGGHLINFYDANDSALQAWRVNNSLFRPQVPFAHFTGTYYYHRDDRPTEKLGVSDTSLGRFVHTTHEAMAYVDASTTLTAGAEGRTAGVIDKNGSIDTDVSYGFSDDHAAEWNRRIQDVETFYYDVLLRCGIRQNPLDSQHP